MGAKERAERVEVLTRAEWRAWLAANHTQREPIWLVTHKKSSPKPSLAYGDLVEECLCFGWIDSVINTVDEHRKMVYVSPRKAGSTWSASNKKRVAKLEQQALIEQAGRAAIERAKADGSWTVLDDVEAMVVPDDLRKALRRAKGATAGFEGLTPGRKKGALWWIKSAKTEPTRAKRIAKVVEAAARGEAAV